MSSCRTAGNPPISDHPPRPPGAVKVGFPARIPMNILNALHMMGYGGFWKSPPGGPEGPLRSLMGFGPTERIVAMIHVGTAKGEGRSLMRADPSGFVSEWQGAEAHVL